MYTDTHCHLNFQAFDGKLDEVIHSAKSAGVGVVVVPGTDIVTSIKAIEISKKYLDIYAAVGIHPHHAIEYIKSKDRLQSDLKKIERMLKEEKVVAVGEVGIDRYVYKKTKHKEYAVDEEFIDVQKILFTEQLKLVAKYKKTLIIHNREAKKDLLEILTKYKSLVTDYRVVFHCCEPDEELLEFAKRYRVFIGVDGDLVYWLKKQRFIKVVPLEMLVLETDSPYLSPFRKFPNEPSNIPFIAKFIAELKGIEVKKVEDQTSANAKKLFAFANLRGCSSA
ncbi:hypothetical protein B6D29_02545 [Microgenomates bacterium UTCPR1]|nr:MAG: hypothetical protein B6D29_02545 [Microgenomates bacterium UTCPR1]